jgi:precorrin-2 dehydrogenase/sirohydrochlorin ferrochelatase
MLDVTQLRIVVIGAGAVAARKVRGLLDAGATRVCVVAPVFDASFPQGVERIAQSYMPERLDGAALVFAATDAPQVNARVAADARARGAMVCRADVDEDEPADFSTPALFRAGEVIVTVSAAGAPAVGAAIRDHLRDALDERWVALARIMRTWRPRIRQCPAFSAARRREAFRALASRDALDTLGNGEAALWDWIVERYPELSVPPGPA